MYANPPAPTTSGNLPGLQTPQKVKPKTKRKASTKKK